MEHFNYNIFPTNIFGYKLDLDHQKIKKECYAIQNLLPSRELSNIGGYQSPDLHSVFLNKNNFSNIKYLTFLIPTLLSQYFKNYNFLTSLKLSNIWININPPSSWNLKHTHPESHFSGTYYVSVPEDSNSGIAFIRNREFVDCGMLNFNEVRDKDNIRLPQFENGRVFYFKSNDIVFFPSYLEHEVGENYSKEDRISISFNCVKEK